MKSWSDKREGSDLKGDCGGGGSELEIYRIIFVFDPFDLALEGMPL